MEKSHVHRAFESTLLSRLKEEPRFIQCILGPRQVGKTSGVLHTLETNFNSKSYQYFACEEEVLSANWLQVKVQKALESHISIIVFDEIQKIDHWSEHIKLLWDKLKREKRLIHFVLLGSSSLQLSIGLEESLAGRFEVIPVFHWSFFESYSLGKLTWKQYLHYGGYPGSYSLLSSPTRFKKYLIDSVFESVVSKDIFRYVTIKKPSLFRQVFTLACCYPAQQFSYNKFLGQLTEAGNVDQIKHYLELLQHAFLLRLIFKWSSSPKSRTSSPKILPLAPVFTSLFLNGDLTPDEQGRVFESTVGNRLCESIDKVFYWQEGHHEVDYIVELNRKIIAIEVKSQVRKSVSLETFKKKFPKTLSCFIDFENYPLFEKDPIKFLENFSL